jgi:hypothetical protein
MGWVEWEMYWDAIKREVRALELACVLVRLDHIANFIVNANHRIA